MAMVLDAILSLQLNELVVIPLVWMEGVAVAAAAQPKPGCRRICGDLQIPYPFGTEEGCYYRDENCLITWYKTSSSGYPRANHSRGNNPVLGISLDGELRISTSVSRDCYSGQINSWSFPSMWFSDFAISNVTNKFTVVGCDTYGDLTEWHNRFSTGCSLTCRNITDVVNGSCSGIGCCQTTFPKAIKAYNISLHSYDDHKYVQDFNPCGYAFLVENGFYNFTIQDLKDVQNKTESPGVVNWTIENKTCSEAMKNTSSYACKEKSECKVLNCSCGCNADVAEVKMWIADIVDVKFVLVAQ